MTHIDIWCHFLPASRLLQFPNHTQLPLSFLMISNLPMRNKSINTTLEPSGVSIGIFCSHSSCGSHIKIRRSGEKIPLFSHDAKTAPNFLYISLLVALLFSVSDQKTSILVLSALGGRLCVETIFVGRLIRLESPKTCSLGPLGTHDSD
jgi:hypothetical protein